jgi:hypothetical protein
VGYPKARIVRPSGSMRARGVVPDIRIRYSHRSGAVGCSAARGGGDRPAALARPPADVRVVPHVKTLHSRSGTT